MTNQEREELQRAVHARRAADGKLRDLIGRLFPRGTPVACVGEAFTVAGVGLDCRVLIRTADHPPRHLAVEADSLTVIPPGPGGGPGMSPQSLTITPTRELVLVDGVLCRVWNGLTAAGESCVLFVARVAFEAGKGRALLEEVLVRTPRPDVRPAGPAAEGGAPC